MHERPARNNMIYNGPSELPGGLIGARRQLAASANLLLLYKLWAGVGGELCARRRATGFSWPSGSNGGSGGGGGGGGNSLLNGPASSGRQPPTARADEGRMGRASGGGQVAPVGAGPRKGFPFRARSRWART